MYQGLERGAAGRVRGRGGGGGRRRGSGRGVGGVGGVEASDEVVVGGGTPP